jgi:hypothetical protein
MGKLIEEKSNKKYWVFGIIIILVIAGYGISKIQFQNISLNISLEKINFWDTPVEFFLSEGNFFLFVTSFVIFGISLLYCLKSLGITLGITNKKEECEDEEDEDEGFI